LQNGGASRFVEVTDKEIREIKINSVPKNIKDLCKNKKQSHITNFKSDWV
jgi:hypothetical protein